MIILLIVSLLCPKQRREAYIMQVYLPVSSTPVSRRRDILCRRLMVHFYAWLCLTSHEPVNPTPVLPNIPYFFQEPLFLLTFVLNPM